MIAHHLLKAAGLAAFFMTEAAAQDARVELQEHVAGVDVDVAVRIGGAQLTVREVLALEPGDVVLLDRDVGLMTAVGTSVRSVTRNPITMFMWGLIIAVTLAIGSIPFFVGIAVVMPVLGHATWHLYRKTVEA